ncbi:MAG: hypothetical protein IPO21_20785 [Bacteroidales bacterium]|nr:hypothetical protein [Bacteroidales bacterium]
MHSKKTKIFKNQEINLIGGKYTTCDLEHPHFYIGLTKAKVIPDDQIVTGPAYVVIEGITLPLILPFGFFPTKKGRANGILFPKFGNDALKGYYIKQGGFYWGVSDYFDLKILGDVYTYGSWLVDVSSSYNLRYKFNGSLSVGVSSIKLEDVRSPLTFDFNWRHNQDKNSMPNGSFGADVNISSAGHNKYNAQTESDLYNNTKRSSISYSHRFPNTPFNLTLALNHNQNSSDSTISFTLPDFTFNMASIYPFKRKNSVGKPKFYEDINLSYNLKGLNRIVDAKMDSSFEMKKFLYDFEQAMQQTSSLKTNLKLFKFISLTPSFNFTDRIYFEKYKLKWKSDIVDTLGRRTGGVVTDTIPGFYNVFDYNFGVGFSTKVYGMYTFKSKYLKAIRHILTPSVTFTYRPDLKDRYWSTHRKNLEMDYAAYSYFQGAPYGTPNANRSTIMAMSISNNLEAKVRNKKDTVTGIKKIKLIENFSISTDYDFLKDSLKLNYIRLSAYTTLFKRFQINYSGSLDPYVAFTDKSTRELVRLRSSMLDMHGRLWRYDNDYWTLGTSLRLGPVPNSEKHIVKRPESVEYAKSDIPWSVNLSYSLNMPRKYYYNYKNELDSIPSNLNQSLGINGSFSLTKNWNITVSTAWDFEAKQITHARINIYRDLHCWDMSLQWIPFGSMKRWEFIIKIKADMFKDIKYEMSSPSSYF